MTIASRLRKTSGKLDARTPAIWISNGTGRDGRDNRNAPKVGWCWAGNRHTWLGFASAAARAGLAARDLHDVVTNDRVIPASANRGFRLPPATPGAAVEAGKLMRQLRADERY